MFLSLTTAPNHFITMLNDSNNELPAISIIFMSRDWLCDLHFYLQYGIKGPGGICET